MTAKNLFIILVVVFVLGVIAIALTSVQERRELVEQLSPEEPVLSPTPPQGRQSLTIYNLSGTLLTIRGDLLTFAVIMEQTPEGRQLSEEKVVRVSPSTKIVRFETVTNPQTGRATVEERSISLRDLRPGDRIQVISNRDILVQEEIEATKVRLLGRE